MSTTIPKYHVEVDGEILFEHTIPSAGGSHAKSSDILAECRSRGLTDHAGRVLRLMRGDRRLATHSYYENDILSAASAACWRHQHGKL